jgi:hypothetical protein
LMPYFISIENKMYGQTADALNGALKVITNHFRCDRGSVVLRWCSSAGPDACLWL